MGLELQSVLKHKQLIAKIKLIFDRKLVLGKTHDMEKIRIAYYQL